MSAIRPETKPLLKIVTLALLQELGIDKEDAALFRKLFGVWATWEDATGEKAQAFGLGFPFNMLEGLKCGHDLVIEPRYWHGDYGYSGFSRLEFYYRGLQVRRLEDWERCGNVERLTVEVVKRVLRLNGLLRECEEGWPAYGRTVEDAE